MKKKMIMWTAVLALLSVPYCTSCDKEDIYLDESPSGEIKVNSDVISYSLKNRHISKGGHIELLLSKTGYGNSVALITFDNETDTIRSFPYQYKRLMDKKGDYQLAIGSGYYNKKGIFDVSAMNSLKFDIVVQ